MGEGYKTISGIVFLFVAISLPVTIFLVNQKQDIRQEATEVPSSEVTGTPGCPAVNPDGTTNTCRPQSYCLSGEIVKYDGNEMCTTSLGRQAFCCTQPKN
ncbi:MAG: hypothetical protein A3C27_01890 [Candidatus Levybacteria bacterium RIFCSPHIGHO2_02_FULL_39_36]|nr:MAG: hypothetical protein A3E68_01215 [Candidatus Levybacteria bacterium RIFCSPHIGHO2_12_FULL_39_39]OGH27459.1 MAG: hypothetical protein A3C27_01890 [Candidatus Levybacteria bacterium RIFCSPHIGHO2_02_FULL_39_36]OGH45422.1 MAG: hypothetical protein A3H82_02975 [Candidatus Levybacteria bacterium RIFCSPLOWO2_02_FULL_39_26]OGH46997.1 MAG: hypothetical protein A3G66_04450 [Candidatus Levybacteria bacterium RIFCSPLOWO2_12_FULL_39_17]